MHYKYLFSFFFASLYFAFIVSLTKPLKVFVAINFVKANDDPESNGINQLRRTSCVIRRTSVNFSLLPRVPSF